jgi:hypothetical protein
LLVAAAARKRGLEMGAAQRARSAEGVEDRAPGQVVFDDDEENEAPAPLSGRRKKKLIAEKKKMRAGTFGEEAATYAGGKLGSFCLPKKRSVCSMLKSRASGVPASVVLLLQSPSVSVLMSSRLSSARDSVYLLPFSGGPCP